MAKKVTNKDEVVMELLEKRFIMLVDSLPEVSKKTMRLAKYEPIETMAKELVASFKVLADKLVDDTQVCNKCGNEVYFERYATYPNAKLNLPDHFGKPSIVEFTHQYDPKGDR